MKKVKYLGLIMLMALMLTGCGGKDNLSNNQQEVHSNNQNNQEVQSNNQDVEEESPLKKLREKFENNDFSDIAGTYELVKFDNDGSYAQTYNNFHAQKLVIDNDGNIYKGEPYSGDTHFPISKIMENTSWNYILLQDSQGAMIGVIPTDFEYKESSSDILPENWNNKSKNRIWARFIEYEGRRNLYYIQVD